MPRFRVPPPQRGNPLWSLLSLIGHAVLTVVLVSVAGPSYLREARPIFIDLSGSGTAGPRQFDMPALGGVPSGVPEGGGGPLAAPGLMPGSPRIDPAAPPSSVPRFYIAGEPNQTGDTTATPVPGMGLRPGGVLRPAWGDGRLWVRVAEAELGIVGPAEDRATHVARVDAAVRERIKAYIDTMPRDSFAIPPPQVWTTEIAGNTWGVDPQWIYLGDIKIPTALLALLPLPQSGNWEQQQDAANLMRIRQEIITAARRAESAVEFRRAVNALRDRMDAERSARRAQRGDTIPDRR